MIIKILSVAILISVGFSNNIDFSQRTIADSLPKNMPLIKKVFWGEDGLFRNTFVDPKSRMRELKIRRNMLQLHQKLALFTLGCMAYQYNIGNRMLDNPNEYGEFKELHMNLGYTTFGTYMGTASLSIFSPPGMKYTNKKFSSNRLHRYLALIHFTGMALQPWLGYQTSVAGIEATNGIEGRAEDYNQLMDIHQVVGGITFTTYFLAFLTTLFK